MVGACPRWRPEGVVAERRALRPGRAGRVDHLSLERVEVELPGVLRIIHPLPILLPHLLPHLGCRPGFSHLNRRSGGFLGLRREHGLLFHISHGRSLLLRLSYGRSLFLGIGYLSCGLLLGLGHRRGHRLLLTFGVLLLLLRCCQLFRLRLLVGRSWCRGCWLIVSFRLP